MGPSGAGRAGGRRHGRVRAGARPTTRSATTPPPRLSKRRWPASSCGSIARARWRWRAPTSAPSSTARRCRSTGPCDAAAGASLRFWSAAAARARMWRSPAASTCPPVLGSRATELGAGFGGFGGRALRAGDRLAVGRSGPATAPPLARAAAPSARRVPVAAARAAGPARRLVRWRRAGGPRAHRFTVTPQSNRMGYRLAADGAAAAASGAAR